MFDKSGNAVTSIQTYEYFLQKVEKRQKGFYGMIQHVFVQEHDANAFVLWLKQHPPLQTKQIEKCCVKKEASSNQDRYIVRLTTEQLETLIGAEEVAKIMQPSLSSSSNAQGTTQNQAENTSLNNKNLTDYSDAEFSQAADPDQFISLTSKAEAFIIKDHRYSQDLKAFQDAVAGHDSVRFQFLVNGLGQSVLDKAVMTRDSDGNTCFASAAVNQDSVSFQLLVRQLSHGVLNEAAMAKNNEDSNGFSFAAEYQDSVSFQLFVSKLSQNALNEAAMAKNKYGSTGFGFAAECQDSASFQLLVRQLSQDALNEGAVAKDKYGDTGFIFAAYKQDSASFQLLVIQLSQGALNKAAIAKNKKGTTGFIAAAYYQNSVSFESLLNKLTSKTIGLAYWDDLKNDDLNFVSLRQASNLLLLWSKLDEGFYQKLAGLDADHPVVIFALNRLLATLKKAPLDSDTVQKFTKVLSELPNQFSGPLVAELCNYFFEGCALSTDPSFLIHLNNSLLNYMKSCSKDKHPKLLAFLEAIQTVRPSDSPIFAEPSPQTLWRQGVRSWHEYRALRLLNKYTINDILEQLLYNNCLFTGSKTRFIPPAAKEVESLLRSGDGLIKIIREKDWPDFLDSLSNFEYPRKLLRKSIDNPTHKFVHSTNEIIPYVKKDKAGKQYTATRKTACTAISPHLLTPLFGFHDPDRILVGVLLDAKECDIKVMLSKDCGTYNHGWLGSESSVKEYREKIKDFNFTDWNAFQKAIEFNEGAISEVLVKIRSPKSIKSFIIGSDSEGAQCLAAQYVSDYQARFGLISPINFYDFKQAKVYEFTPTMQEENILSSRLGYRYNLENEIEIKLRLVEVSGKIKSKQALSSSPAIFRKAQGFFDLTGEQKILIAIQKAKVAENEKYTTSHYTWSAAEADLKKIPLYNQLLAELISNTDLAQQPGFHA